MGLLLGAISRRQEKAVEILGTPCGDVSEDRTWVEESIRSKNIHLEDIEAQDVSPFP